MARLYSNLVYSIKKHPRLFICFVLFAVCSLIIFFSAIMSHATGELAGEATKEQTELAAAKIKTQAPINTEFPTEINASLQALLDKNIKKRSLDGLVDEKKLSITLLDVTDINRPQLAHINGSNTLYAASLPKIAILLAVFEEIYQGNLTMSKDLRKSLDNMIKRSSNTDATKLYELVGAQRIATILRSDKYKFYDEETGGGLWVGKPYAKDPVWKRDPLMNVSHGASGLQVARFYYMLERNELTHPSYCPVMKDILANSEINHKFVKGLNSHQPTAAVYRKSGTWRDYHSDSALIEREDGIKYIAVALSQSSKGGKLLENIIVDLDNIIDTFHKSHAGNAKNTHSK